MCSNLIFFNLSARDTLTIKHHLPQFCGRSFNDCTDRRQRSFGQITARLSRKYNAPEEQIVEDSSGFLDALRVRRFLDVI